MCLWVPAAAEGATFCTKVIVIDAVRPIACCFAYWSRAGWKLSESKLCQDSGGLCFFFPSVYALVTDKTGMEEG
jgi:hypothetical protein